VRVSPQGEYARLSRDLIEVAVAHKSVKDGGMIFRPFVDFDAKKVILYCGNARIPSHIKPSIRQPIRGWFSNERARSMLVCVRSIILDLGIEPSKSRGLYSATAQPNEITINFSRRIGR
jgi:hypothetical protein